jgi:hypothetical protein
LVPPARTRTRTRTRTTSRQPLRNGYPYGWTRSAYTQLPSGTWMLAELWRDNLFVTLISTAWICSAPAEVRRWTSSERARVPRTCSLALKKYTQCMNFNDIANKAAQEANVRMGRCPRRFQRQLFWYLIGAVFLTNVRVAFCALLAAADLAALKREVVNDGVGFNWWFQERLGEELIELGVTMKKKAKLGTPRTRLQHGLVPHGMPDAGKRRRRSSARSLDLDALPSKHELVKADKVVIEWGDNRQANVHMPYQSRCVACTATAVQYEKANGKRGKTTRMPPTTTGEGRNKRTVRLDIPKVSTTACSKCHVHLCPHCFEDAALWDHDHKCVPCATVVTC